MVVLGCTVIVIEKGAGGCYWLVISFMERFIKENSWPDNIGRYWY